MVGYVLIDVKRFVSRSWYFFRTGYGTYLSLLLGLGETLVALYYLLIRNTPWILAIFPTFESFVLAFVFVGIPVAVSIGYIHFKHSPIYTSEVDISYESNPYMFKLPKGYNRTVFMPLYIELLTQLKEIRMQQGNVSPEAIARIENVESSLRKLQRGEVA